MVIETTMKNIFYKKWKLSALLLLLIPACVEEAEKPTLPAATSFVAPVFESPATSATTVELLPENESAVFETFKWKVADYGVNVSVRYELEISDDEDFTKTASLIVAEGNRGGSTREVPVTVKVINDKMLALGLPGFQQATVYIRVKSTINGFVSAPLFSGSIERKAITYQTSDCGAYCTVGLIGGATTGSDETGWVDDIDMRLLDPTGADKSTWTTTVYLYGGLKVKFRAQDSWDVNWGADAFPSGTGTQGGADILIPTSGYYKIIFNDQTGEYSFTSVGTTVYSTIGLIGSALTGSDEDGWNTDVDLTQDESDPHIWTGTISLFAGAAKFRANDAWDDNWGSNTYPSGFGTGGGPDIPITVAGTYFIWFNDATGEYFFGPTANATPYASIGLVGSTLTGNNDGWDEDIDMIQNPSNPYKWSKIFNLYEGAGKFRADNDWGVNWGASGFPSGIGVQGGADIPVQEGSYFVSFNSLTGEYKFLK